MREYKIYGEAVGNPDTRNFHKFMKEVEERINADDSILENARNCNAKFAERIKEFLSNEENVPYIGGMVGRLQETTSRFMYIKHLKYGESEYEAEIDLLERKFYLHRV